MNDNKTVVLSEQISAFCKLLDSAPKEYEWHGSEVQRLDRLTQDYLHALELDHLKYGGRAKVATKLAECRQERRKHKDVVLVLEPLVEYLASDKGRRILDQLREVLGKTRKEEKHLRERSYVPRELENGG